MPDKPLWLERLPGAIRQLQEISEPWVDRPGIESLLGVGRRRAQQLLSPIGRRRVGTSIVADRTDVIRHLEKIAAGETAYYEQRRREQLSARLSQARDQWLEQPPVLVEISREQVRKIELHDIDGLPEGVELTPGAITVRFSQPAEALQKLMTLAMAIGRNQEEFEKRVSVPGMKGTQL